MTVEFIVRGATLSDEPGVVVAFEESREDLIANVASLGFDVADLEASGRLVIGHIEVDGRSVEETGDRDLEGLFLHPIARPMPADAVPHALATLGS